MNPLETVFATQAYRDRCEDRVSIFVLGTRTVIVVADGAGGIGSGDIAAQSVVREIESCYRKVHSANEWVDLLREIDQRIGPGESTVAVVDIRDYGIAGASVGDSRVMVLTEHGFDELTSNQVRKPLLGSGNCEPIGFQRPSLDGLLIVGTDGLFDYLRFEAIAEIVRNSDFHSIPRRCIQKVQLASGEFWDDVGIVAARRIPHRPRRQRYSLDGDC